MDLILLNGSEGTITGQWRYNKWVGLPKWNLPVLEEFVLVRYTPNKGRFIVCKFKFKRE